MCIHFWKIDSVGLGRCKHCGIERKFAGYLGSEENWHEAVTLEKLGSTSGGYYMQGKLHSDKSRPCDYTFAVDTVDLLC